MRMIGQTLSLVGLLALAALVAVIVQSLSAGIFAWGRALLALAIALVCFWAAGQVSRRR
ncbi:hypothetical protein [Palleronia sp.]|uniref:hypothetical protein n=1 Tax=Palleronia sp. TaxID=1940284 RepID=UPI0035C807D1